MRLVVQRVSKASVLVNGKIVGRIGRGFLVLLGVDQNDTEKELNWLAKKLVNLRIMADENKKMNLCLKDTSGGVLVISQFTLLADCRRGNRPSFVKTAEPKKAEKFYRLFIEKLKSYNVKVESGVFGAMMQVSLVNDGPVTIILER